MQGQSRVKYEIPTRGLLGLKNALLSATRGTAVLNTQFLRYDAYIGDFSTRENGSLVAFETGQVTAYALQSAQDRGILFCKPGAEVYEGQVVGIHQRAGDLKINVAKKKALTNMRASGKDNSVALDGSRELSLDDWCAAALAASWCHSLQPQSTFSCVVHFQAVCVVLGLAGALTCGGARSLEYIVDDELVEVTPVNVRIRKNPDIKARTGKKK